MKNYQKIAEGLEKQVKALRQQKRELKLINVLQKEALFELMPHDFPAPDKDELAMIATAFNHLPDEQWEQFNELRNAIKRDANENIIPEYGTEAYWVWQLNNNPQAGSYEAKMLYCLYEDIPNGVLAEEWVNTPDWLKEQEIVIYSGNGQFYPPIVRHYPTQSFPDAVEAHKQNRIKHSRSLRDTPQPPIQVMVYPSVYYRDLVLSHSENEWEAVNLIRHYHSNYHEFIYWLSQQSVDKKEVHREVKKQYIEEIGRLYPDLQWACKKQIEEMENTLAKYK